MKVDLKLIRSLEIIQKPDGRYIRIGYVKPESQMENTKEQIRERISRAWRNRVVKTTVIAIAAAVLYHMTKNLTGM